MAYLKRIFTYSLHPVQLCEESQIAFVNLPLGFKTKKQIIFFIFWGRLRRGFIISGGISTNEEVIQNSNFDNIKKLGSIAVFVLYL